MRRLCSLLALLVLPAVLPAQAKGGSGVVTINAYDFFYEAPNPIPAGVTTLRLVNKGKDFHHVWIVKLDEGYAFSDFMQSLGPGRPIPAWATGIGGPESPEPGQSTDFIMALEPGRYALACLLPSQQEHVTHMNKGMFLPFTVTKATTKRAMPKADGNITILESGVDAPDTVTAGKHVFKVMAVGSKPVGFRLAMLAAGKTAADADAWIAAGATGPAPFKLLGGTTPLTTRITAFMPVTLAAGNYVLLGTRVDPQNGDLVYQKGNATPMLVK